MCKRKCCNEQDIAAFGRLIGYVALHDKIANRIGDFANKNRHIRIRDLDKLQKQVKCLFGQYKDLVINKDKEK
jgi:hypothetical protein